MALILAAAYFGVSVGGHAVLCRLPLATSAVVKYVLVGGVVGIVLVGHLFWQFGLGIALLAGALCYALASELYIFTFTLVPTSISSLWLRRLRRGSLATSAASALFGPDWMVESRLERLTENGFLTRDGGSYRLTAKSDRLLAVFRRLRAFFGHERYQHAARARAGRPGWRSS